MVPEAPLAETNAGLVPAGEGWFVVNAREARWIERPVRGVRCPLTGWSDEEVDLFPQLGVNVVVLGPGEPLSMYHGEEDQEDFLVLAGSCLLVVEGEERQLARWDFVHCPPWTEHTIVGAGGGPCVVLAVGARSGRRVRYPVNEAALRHGAGVERETEVPAEAYARFEEQRPTRYGGWLPE